MSSLAFARGDNGAGPVLYSAGWDKRVHVWRHDVDSQRFRYDRAGTIRVPVGPGLSGGLNTVAVSPDGRWLAVAGRGTTRNQAGLRDPGLIWPAAAMSPEMRLDEGLIYVYERTGNAVRLLRGHRGAVQVVTFADATRLVSTGDEWRGTTVSGSVRVWDVAASRELAQLPGLPAPQGRPGLAAWPTGPDAKAVRVAVAWGDNHFRVWDAGKNQFTQPTFEKYPVTAAVVPGPGRDVRVLAGTVGKLGIWSVPAGRDGQLATLDAARSYRLLAQLQSSRGPLAAVVFTVTGKVPDHAAVIVQDGGARDQAAYRLLVVELAGGRVKSDVLLWEGPLKHPALAVDPAGKFVAVAGNARDEVLVFETAKLLRGPAVPQTLRSQSIFVEQVGFAAKDDGLGLRLRISDWKTPALAASSSKPAEALFDVAEGILRNDVSGWKRTAPPVADWSVMVKSATGQQPAVCVVGHAGKDREIPFPAAVVTTAAICPPTGHCPFPLLAVATQQRGEPFLMLFDAATGEQVRQLTGHSEVVHSLAFSADGRLLASAARDCIVCLWWLPDLPESLGGAGLLRGMEVTRRDGQVVVVRDTASRLRVGERILGAVVRDELVPFPSPWEFYQFMAAARPGLAVTLQVSDADGKNPRLVKLTINRPIDERKALVSLFLRAGANDRAPQWIGWDALGKYDSSGGEGERSLGWLFNTGDAALPTRHATADQYREQNFEPGLIRMRTTRGPVREAEPPPRPPMVSLSLVPEGGAALQRDYDDRLLLRDSQVQVSLTHDFPPQRIASVRWRLGAQDPQPFVRASAREWTADLTPFIGKRGVYDLRAVLVTNEQPPREFAESELIRFQPPAPAVTAVIPQQVKEPQLTVAFKTAARVFIEGEAVELRITQQFHGKVVQDVQRRATREQPIVRHEFDLAEGANQIEVTAVNAQALDGFTSLEETRQRWVVERRTPEQPQITLQRLVLLPPAAGEVAYQPGESTIVDVSRVRVEAEIAAMRDPLTSVELFREDQRIALPDFMPDKRPKYTLKADLTLEPGRQVVRCTAVAGKPHEQRWELEFRPQLPSLASARILDPMAGTPLSGNVRIAGRDSTQVRVVVMLAPPERLFPHAAEVLILINGKPALNLGEPVEPFKIQVGAAIPEIQATLDLQPGRNSIKLQIRSPWRTSEPVELGQFELQRPPQLVKLIGPPESETPFVSLEAEFQSPAELPLKRVVVLRNGTEIACDIQFALVGGFTDRWSVTASRLPLETGSNLFRMTASNAEGVSLSEARDAEGKPLELATSFAPPKPKPKPELQWASPARGGTVAESKLAVQFRVRSADPLQRLVVAVVRPPFNPRELVVPLEKLPAADAEGFRLVDAAVELEAGNNLLVLEAENGGGRATAMVNVNYVPPPVRVLVDRIVPRFMPGTALTRSGVDASGATRFAAAPDALVTIHGRLEWAGKPAAGDQYVKTWVNGFLQESQPFNGTAFQAQVVLNREHNNRVTLEFPNIPASESNLHILLDTPKPERQQRLHLVVIGLKLPGDQADAAEKLKIQAEQALTERLDPEGRDPAVYFEQPIRHYPEGKHALTGDFGAEDVYGLLRVVSRNINSASRVHPSGDVLMIYYRGRERVAVDRQIELLTGRTTSVPSRFLSAYLSDIRGAHLLFLDVERGGLLAGDSWPNDPHLGLLRVVWNDPQRKAPENTPLISALDAIRRAGSGATGKEVRLEHLEAALVKIFEPVHGRSLEFRPEVPDALRELVLGKSADE